MAKKAKWRPFHEVISDVIDRASSTELYLIAKLLKETKIPKDHDRIIKRWKWRLEGPHWCNSNYFGVVDALLEQKEAIEKRRRRQKKPSESLEVK